MFTTISNWFGSLDSTMQVFWACAVAASVVFVIQNALMLLGIGDMDSDVDADVSSDFDVHTDLDGDGVGDSVAIFVVLMRALLKLEKSGNFKIQDCVGQTASVYLRIPANHSASGKVQISINGSVHEITAFTDGEALPTGSRVTVVKVIDSGSLLVERILNS